MEELEDRYAESEETLTLLRRKLQMAEEEATDFQALLEGREGQNAILRQDLDALQEKWDFEASKCRPYVFVWGRRSHFDPLVAASNLSFPLRLMLLLPY